MKAFLAAQALVQIIGLAFLHHDPSAGVQVVFPRVEQGSKSHVEGHTTIIAYKTADRLSETGWKSRTLKPVPGWSYIVLNGEKVSVVTNGKNKRAAVPAGLPHLAPKTCPGMAKLQAGYQPPSYKSAAAVVTLREGNLQACRAQAPDVVGRIDTKIELVTSGGFKVTAPGKSVKFRDDSLVLFANVPSWWLQGSPGIAGLSGPHSGAYYALGANMKAPCRLEPVKGFIPDCYVTPASIPGAKVPPHVPHQFEFMTYECSNTQWP